MTTRSNPTSHSVSPLSMSEMTLLTQAVANLVYEAVGVIDEKVKKVLFFNRSFKKIFLSKSSKFSKDENALLYEKLTSNRVLGPLIQEAASEIGTVRGDVNLHKKVYQVKIVTFEACLPKTILMVTLSNLRHQRYLEKTKRDLVSNVSHELRTPLTAIKGFLEGLLEEETDMQKKHYFEIISRNTDRLVSMIDDLLTLSRLEDKQTSLDLEPVNLKFLLEQVMVLFEKSVREKNLHLKLDISDNLPMAHVDAFKIEQAFINLIDNAVKYTDHGTIHLRLFPEGELLCFVIEDTGIGMKKKYLDRICERFYVVNKSRSRLNGGTGLGLSIVKHICMLHKAPMSIQSKPDEGTRIQIKFRISHEK